MYKIMLSDLDETLLVEHHVPPFNVEAICKARKQGLKFVPATGRAYNMIQEILSEIDAKDKEDEYSICFNGALIVENKNDRILRFKGISFDQMNHFYQASKQYDVCVLIFTLDMCYILRPDPSEVERKIQQKAKFKIIEEKDLIQLKEEKIAKLLFERRDMDYLKQIKEDLKQEIEDYQVTASFSSNRYLEINTKGIDKGEALKWLADYLKIEVGQTIAIGDNYNDESMIKEAGLGVAVACASDDIKELADYVTKNDYHQGAVKEVIEKFILEEK